ncbi:MAG TPA: hypothetical protein VN541_04970, partial [Tepidisphaeraceae bacterium]|nr:hypothetical protein [Tepidisphaeraceae bacterium]
RIETVTSVHAFVVEFDAICTRDIDSGKLAPTTQLHDLLQTTLKLFQQACGEILKDAAEFTRKGIPVIGLAAIKKIHAEPGDGLQMAQMLGLASQLNAGDGQPPHEVEFPEEIHAVMAGKNKPFANIA